MFGLARRTALARFAPLLGLWSCNERAPLPQSGTASAPSVARPPALAAPTASVSATASSDVLGGPTRRLRQADANGDPEPERAEPPGPKTPSKLVLDEPAELGPSGPARAEERGVLMITKSDELVLAPNRGAWDRSPRSRASAFKAITSENREFSALGRAPALLRKKAYWISGNRLVRRALDGSGATEVLSTDAQPGTRVATADIEKGPALALYVSQRAGDDVPRARLWVEGGSLHDISPEGAGASSVTAVGSGSDLIAVAIDARSAMTPLHGRRVHFEAGNVELSPDVVMWVGASAQTLSEVFALNTPFGVRALLPIERDVTHFGLFMFEVGSEPKMDPRFWWRGYPNGLDVAPVSGAVFCGSAYVAYARPTTADPSSPAQLEVAEVREGELGPAEVVAKARLFVDVSMAAAGSGAVLAYAADRRTFAATLRCKR